MHKRGFKILTICQLLLWQPHSLLPVGTSAFLSGSWRALLTEGTVVFLAVFAREGTGKKIEIERPLALQTRCIYLGQAAGHDSEPWQGLGHQTRAGVNAEHRKSHGSRREAAKKLRRPSFVPTSYHNSTLVFVTHAELPHQLKV